MNNSILMLSAGVIVGIAATLLIVNYQSDQTPATTIDSASRLPKELQVNKPSSDTENIARQEIPASVNSGSSGMYTPDQAMQNMSNSMEDFNDRYSDSPSTTDVSSLQSLDDSATSLQVKRFHSIDARLSAAANNPSVDLTELIEDADLLTASQRDQLTKKAMQMIENKTLSPSQFNSPPGS